MSGDVVIRIQNLKPGNAITKTMKSGELVIGESITPFILQRLAHGSINKMSTEQTVCTVLACYESLRSTPFTRQGYISLLMTFPQVQMWIYIEKDRLYDLAVAFCRAAV